MYGSLLKSILNEIKRLSGLYFVYHNGRFVKFTRMKWNSARDVAVHLYFF